MLKLWNTATKKLEEIVPIVPGQIGLYTCGPTVYWDATIGNFRSFLFEDVLERTLRMENFSVKRVMNITDVGHLTDDADEGEDKMQKAANKEGRRAQDIAETYTQRFLMDATKLNISLPQPPYLCKATDHIPEQIELVRVLEAKGYAYRTSDGVYFDTSKFSRYGALSGQKLEEKEEGARVSVNLEKRNKTDFALWKFSYPGGREFDSTQDDAAKRRHMEWASPWGLGFPGWHIECSAMSRKYLGQPFDIHCGGVDHISVHHENEIAQSEAAFGVPLAQYWMHNEFLLVDSQKMSKSLGNIYTVSEVIAHGYDPLALRWFFLGAHYRQKQNFTWEALEAAQQALRRLRHLVRSWDAPQGRCVEIETEFREHLEDDLNTPRALATVWKLVESSESTAAKSATLLWMDRVLGMSLDQYVARPVQYDAVIATLVRERDEARCRKDWPVADRLRAELEAKGWLVEDTASGTLIVPRDEM